MGRSEAPVDLARLSFKLVDTTLQPGFCRLLLLREATTSGWAILLGKFHHPPVRRHKLRFFPTYHDPFYQPFFVTSLITMLHTCGFSLSSCSSVPQTCPGKTSSKSQNCLFHILSQSCNCNSSGFCLLA